VRNLKILAVGVALPAMLILSGCWGDGAPSKDVIASLEHVSASMISDASRESAKPKNGYNCSFVVNIPRTGSGLLGAAHSRPDISRFYKDTNGNWQEGFAFQAAVAARPLRARSADFSAEG